eukprot:163095-Hanusia_phi.AAC.1
MSFSLGGIMRLPGARRDPVPGHGQPGGAYSESAVPPGQFNRRPGRAVTSGLTVASGLSPDDHNGIKNGII